MIYKTIADRSVGEFKDRGSKFVAYAFPAHSEEAWQGHLEEVKKEHLKARHHCYAFRLGMDSNNFRANDDGEPSGTAGRPILGQIDSFGLTNVFVVVVRYFGGTKLGTSGLINAYRTSAQVALKNAEVIEKSLDEIFQITFNYALMSQVMNTIKRLELEIVEQDFGEIGKIQIAIPKDKVEHQ
ncbi:MAG: YigZ family protein, partial [Bacteroidota bacterium]